MSAEEVRLAAKPVVRALFVTAFFLAVFLSAFHAPRPHDAPVALAGPPAEVARARALLDRALPGRLDLRSAADAGAAHAAVRGRDAYAAVVLSGTRADVLYAGANGPVAAGFFRTAVPGVLARSGLTPRPQDVAPAAAADVSGLSLFYVAFGTVLGAFIFSVISVTATERALTARAHLLACVAFAAGTAVLVPGVVAAVGVLDGGDLPGLALVVGLLALGTALASVLMLKLSRSLGTLVPSLVLLTLGNASGGTVPPAFLPPWLSWLAPLLPGGVALSGLRGLVSFDGAGYGRALVVLAVWVLVPLLALARLDHAGPFGRPASA